MMATGVEPVIFRDVTRGFTVKLRQHRIENGAHVHTKHLHYNTVVNP